MLYMHIRFCSYFNPRPPRGGRLSQPAGIYPYQYFNPRPPRGGRPIKTLNWRYKSIFQSTPPARGATILNENTPNGVKISIHAPREGGDSKDAQFYL